MILPPNNIFSTIYEDDLKMSTKSILIDGASQPRLSNVHL